MDDLKLGLILRRAGKRTRAFLAFDDIECQWGISIANMIQVTEKNFFAALDYRLWLVLAGLAFTVLISSILILALLSGTPAGLIAFLSPLSLIFSAVIVARRLGRSWTCAVFMWFMFPVFLYALVNSTFVTLRQGGIRWRDTFYPLDTLRAGNVR